MTHRELGQALRRWRDQVSPEAAGLPGAGARRAPGLRREEVAMLAGISADYLTRLEQGRATNPSGQVLEALARALRLPDAERAHLYAVAGMVPPGPRRVSRHLPPGVLRMLDRLGATPVAVFDAAWTLVVANQPYTALRGEPAGPGDRDRNAVWRNFCGRDALEVTAEHAVEDTVEDTVQNTPTDGLRRALVADLRGAAARYPDDAHLHRLIRELREHSEHFRRLWDSGVVGEHVSARKTIHHPQVGPLTLDCDILTVAGADLRVMVYTAEPGTEDAERLALLTVLGTQSFADQT